MYISFVWILPCPEYLGTVVQMNLDEILLFVCLFVHLVFFFPYRVSLCGPGCCETQYGAEANLKLTAFLLPPCPDCWDYTRVSDPTQTGWLLDNRKS